MPFFHRMAQNVYWENCTYRTVPTLIFVTAKAVKGIRESLSYQIFKKMWSKSQPNNKSLRELRNSLFFVELGGLLPSL